jgi:hypothetical protein
VANLADLGAVVDVLSAELLKASAAIPQQQRAPEADLFAHGAALSRGDEPAT